MAAPSDESGAVVAKGFTVIPIKFSEKCQNGHQLFVKEHSVRSSHASKPRDRTLFVLNIPPYATHESLKRLFSTCGKVEHVFMQQAPSNGPPQDEDLSKYFKSTKPLVGFCVAYVVFKNSLGVKKAKGMCVSEPLLLSSPETPLVTGMRKWTRTYEESQADVAELKKEVDSFMVAYDERIEMEKTEALEREGVPDEDGWVTVTRHSKNKAAPRTETHEKKVTNKEKRKRKEKELLNFYTFQARESKRQHIVELRQKFEEDKSRIASMKAARKFKPY